MTGTAIMWKLNKALLSFETIPHFVGHFILDIQHMEPYLLIRLCKIICNVTGHRFDCSRDNRRYSTKSNVSSSYLNKRGTEASIVSSLPIRIPRKSFDHSPHEVSFLLQILCHLRHHCCNAKDELWGCRLQWYS